MEWCNYYVWATQQGTCTWSLLSSWYIRWKVLQDQAWETLNTWPIYFGDWLKGFVLFSYLSISGIRRGGQVSTLSRWCSVWLGSELELFVRRSIITGLGLSVLVKRNKVILYNSVGNNHVSVWWSGIRILLSIKCIHFLWLKFFGSKLFYVVKLEDLYAYSCMRHGSVSYLIFSEEKNAKGIWTRI